MLPSSDDAWQIIKSKVPLSAAAWNTLASAVPRPIKRLMQPLIPGLAQLVNNRQDPAIPPAPLTPEQRTFWNENGFLILPRFFGQYRLDEISNLVQQLWQSRRRADNPLIIDSYYGTPRERRMYFRDVPDAVRETTYKINDSYLEYDLMREISLDPRLCQILAELLDGAPMVCNTLNLDSAFPGSRVATL